MDFADLVQSAEQLTTDCDLSILSGGPALHSTALGSTSAAAAKGARHGGGGGAQDHGLLRPQGAPADLPRVERNLSQLVEAGQQLLSKTARGDIGGQGRIQFSIWISNFTLETKTPTNVTSRSA